MSTVFDFATVVAFACIVGAYLKWGEGDKTLLLRLMLSAIAFAVANQAGNAGYVLLAIALLMAGVGYAVIIFRR